MTSTDERDHVEEAAQDAERAAEQRAELTDEPIATGAVLRADVVATLRKLRDVRRSRDTLTAEEGDLLNDVRAAARDGNLAAGEYTDEAGNKILTLSRPASFDEATARRNVPATLLPAISKRVPDAGKLDAALADGTITREVYDALTVEKVDGKTAKENLPPKVYARCLAPAANPTVKPA